MTDDLNDKITAIQAKYADELMKKANVVGVGLGMKQQNGETTDNKCIVVLVTHKVPESELDPEDIIPKKIEGIPTDVQETGGMFKAQ